MTPSDEFYVRSHPDEPTDRLIAAMGRKPTAKLRREVERVRAEAQAAAAAEAAAAERGRALGEVIKKSQGGTATVAVMTAAAASRPDTPAAKDDVPSRHLRGAVHRMDVRPT